MWLSNNHLALMKVGRWFSPFTLRQSPESLFKMQSPGPSHRDSDSDCLGRIQDSALLTDSAGRPHSL